MNYECTKNQLSFNDEWTMIQLQVKLTMVMFVNVGIHNTKIQCLWEKF